MTEEEARAWVRERWGVSRETQLDAFASLLRDESQRQNLVAASTVADLWSRHIVDSAQLLPLAEAAREGGWIDVGTGAGFPGIVVAILSDREVALVEPRARRVAYLEATIAALGLTKRVTVHGCRIEHYAPARPAAVISARAVAELTQLVAASAHCSDANTLWLLPKGRSAQSEVAAARRTWQGLFHVEPSITQADSGIVVARGVKRR